MHVTVLYCILEAVFIEALFFATCYGHILGVNNITPITAIRLSKVNRFGVQGVKMPFLQ